MESRFHYNAVENAIIRAMARLHPPPPTVMTRAWRMVQERRGLRLLDVGSGTGHWVDFMMEVFHVAHAVGVEWSEQMSAFVRRKYADRPGVMILSTTSLTPHSRSPMPAGPSTT
jgi:SAM-dependent methyltransferase